MRVRVYGLGRRALQVRQLIHVCVIAVQERSFSYLKKGLWEMMA